MATLTYAELRNPYFYQAMQKIAMATSFKDPRVLMSVAQLYRQVHKAWKDSDAIHQGLIEEYGLRDEATGKVKQGEEEGRVFLRPESLEEYSAKDKEFRETKISFKVPKFSVDDLIPAEVSAQDINALTPFLKVLKAV